MEVGVRGGGRPETEWGTKTEAGGKLKGGELTSKKQSNGRNSLPSGVCVYLFVCLFVGYSPCVGTSPIDDHPHTG
jgi:hypothetical protein